MKWWLALGDDDVGITLETSNDKLEVSRPHFCEQQCTQLTTLVSRGGPAACRGPDLDQEHQETLTHD